MYGSVYWMAQQLLATLFPKPLPLLATSSLLDVAQVRERTHQDASCAPFEVTVADPAGNKRVARGRGA